ncbi:RagB/SusD family nutrient uptake outer membrane protein [Draconibacterium sp.]|uniref:RagB/SusD family nutrient uptake outer membrane protein n=1 Tax=Draconibacterium sp. TaxID=1965318 RepID=UPI003561DC8C
MKNFLTKKYYFVLLAFGALVSCQDILDETPSDKLSTERLLKSESGINGFRDQAYSYLDNDFTSHHSGEMLEVYTDDAVRAGSGACYNWHSGNLSADNTIFANGLWSRYWGGIRKCNLALEYMPQSQVPEDKISPADIERWMDEVKVLRAWYHFELIRNFGPLPFIREVIYDDYDGFQDIVRPEFGEIAAEIIAELDEVINNEILPVRSAYPSEYSKINLAVAHALKSRVALYAASALNNPNNDTYWWELAKQYSSGAITNLQGEYGLISIEDYQNLFTENIDVKNIEVLFRGNNQEAINKSDGVDLYGFLTNDRTNNCGAVPSQELVDCFEMLDGTLPVSQYDSEHVNPTFSNGYSENAGNEIYKNRDARLNYAVVFNGCDYGRYKSMPQGDPNIVIYTYEGKEFTGFNANPLSQEEADKRRSVTGYYGRKFKQAAYWGSTVGNTQARKIYFRMAELYLNLAEAECELGNLDDAINALDVIRNRAGQPGLKDVPGFQNTKAFVKARIRNERRVELCFEGHRFYDQRRWKDLSGINIVTGMKITSSNNNDDGEFSYERVKINLPREAGSEKYYYLPLSVEEARRLTGIGQPSEYY